MGGFIEAITLTEGYRIVSNHTKNITLPDKPSELIRLALADLALCAADPNYRIDMTDWHSPDNGVCQVCLAGAVMAKSLNAPPAAGLHWIDFPDNSHKIESLNDFRMGDVGRALAVLDIDVPDDGDYVFNRTITPYDKDPDAFMADMRHLADDLDAAGY